MLSDFCSFTTLLSLFTLCYCLINCKVLQENLLKCSFNIAEREEKEALAKKEKELAEERERQATAMKEKKRKWL